MPAAMAIEMRMTTPVARKSIIHVSQLAFCLLFEMGGGKEKDLRCWSKLKFAIELNKPATVPGEPDWEVDTTKGVNDAPSNRADEALPKDESDSVPDIIKTRSGSMIPLLACVFCRGTMVNCETSVPLWRVEPARK